MSLPSPELIDALRAALDANAVLVGDEATAFLIDPRNKPTADEAVVVRPADTAGVAATVAICAEHQVAGLGRLHGCGQRFLITDLTHQDHIGVFT